MYMPDSIKWEHAQPLFLSNQDEAPWLMVSSNLGQYKLGERPTTMLDRQNSKQNNINKKEKDQILHE